ncbi:MAG: TonB-dependent receptor [Petrimonas sp.]|uniref:SusC/RagA family TonB-linked outer membrane protein n=1 Tax=Petrimonas sp. TaxID=2023866 RepID=UPI000959E3AB|nr:TonB-dependent receptor [Petrimonas sp.]MEA4978442.1 TonB-dependent receptor [Petrimonas sp.]MEA5044253.1 TonB-dependent receptor [Petrimonas sp.]OJV37440.1 MAG: SusC/RagA family protein [Bacteroidia bacterium 43-41]
MKLKIATVFSFLFCSFLLSAQQITVSGTVTEGATGDPAIGVSVLVKGTTNGTVTDIDGKYSLSNVSSDAILVFSYIGMLTREEPVNKRSSIDITLQEDVRALEEVVVIGYGTSKVKDLTSSITTIKPDEIMKTPASQPMSALQGKVPGLQIVSSGSPGSSPTVRVRGIGSYPGRDNEAPLYVVDGVFYNDIGFLNSADINSVSILKDASAAAIYGVRAANGVILVETKSGQFDKKPEITFDGYYGVQVAQNVLKMSNAEQFVTMVMESGSSTDIGNIDKAMQRYGRSRVNPNIPDVNTDWYKEILRTAPIQNYNFDVSGGGSNVSYSVGANYFAQQGLLDMKNEYERYNFRSKLDFKATDWLKLGSNFIWSQSTQYPEEVGAWNLAYFAVPILPVYDESNTQATPIHFANAQDIGYRGGQNPFPTMQFSNKRDQGKRLLSNFYAEATLIPSKLVFKTTYNQAYYSQKERHVFLPYYIGNNFQRANSELIKKQKTYSDVTWDNLLTYTDKFGNHNLSVMGGTSFRDESFESLEGKGLNFPIGKEQSWYLDQAETIPVDDVKNDGSRQYGISYFGRLSYNYANKYLFYATMRADGSSKYQEKWGYFPTVGIGWVLTEEDFLKNNDFINFLKLRASWGQLGNDKIQASDGALTTSVITTALGDILYSGATVGGVFSSLRWELTEETNVGVTANLLKNRLSLDADYYIRDTKEAAINVKIPAIGGDVLRNVGVIRNSGFELALDWNDRISGNFRYNVGANISTLKNEVRNLYGQPYIDGGSAEFRQRSIIGKPLLAFYGYEVTGVYQNEAEIEADTFAKANGLVPGDLKYRDTNKDGEINDDDRVVLGSYFPNFMYGANFGLEYKNFDFSLSLMGQSGNKILNRKRGEFIWTNDTNIDADLAKNRWHGEGTSNSYPSSAGLRKGWNQKMSTFFVEDGSFFRIQNIQLGYNIQNQHWLGYQIPFMRVYLTADRPFTLFNYNGFNPEVANGIDTQTYPIPSTYTVGLTIKF